MTVANRVDRLTAEVRRAERQLAAIERGREALEARQRSQGEAGGGDGQRAGDGGGGEPQEAAEGERVAQQLRTAEAHAVRVRERLESDRADLAHWQAVRARQVADGTATDFGRHNVAAGDRVRVRDVWCPVVRANAKTVTVFGMFGPRTTPWQEVQAHQQAHRRVAAVDGAEDWTGAGQDETGGRG